MITIGKKFLAYSLHRLPTYAVALCLIIGASQASAQTLEQQKERLMGDSDPSQTSLATDVSPKIDRASIAHAVEKVGSWQLGHAEAGFSQDWTFGALYTGYMAVPDAAGGKKFREAMLRMGTKYEFQPGRRIEHADDQAISQTFLDLYGIYHDPKMIKPTQDRMDAEMKIVDDPAKPLWWWCDALYMAPAVLVKLSKDTGDARYINFMDHEWWITSGLLYNRKTHLYYRDASYFDKHEKNGESIYWARGNGWVFAGLAHVLSEMPSDYPSRPRYVAQFKEMAAEIASLQGSDGLWSPGLLDAKSYPYSEVSGSAFFVYGFSWGVNNGLLERQKYQPVAEKGWAAMVGHIYPDGRLGGIQPVGAAPGVFEPTSSYVYGVGAFLLAGSELYKQAH